MPRRTIRLTTETDERIQSATKLRGYSSPSAFLRAAIKKELSERTEAVSLSAKQMVGCVKEVRQDLRRVERSQQALFALVDSLAKVFLVCPNHAEQPLNRRLRKHETATPGCSTMRVTRCSVIRSWRWRS